MKVVKTGHPTTGLLAVPFAFVLSTTQPCLSTRLDELRGTQVPVHGFVAYNELIVETTVPV